MTRRLVFAALLLGTFGAGTSAAFAESTTSAPGTTVREVKYVCVVAFSDPNKPQRQGICIDTPNLPF